LTTEKNYESVSLKSDFVDYKTLDGPEEGKNELFCQKNNEPMAKID